MRYKKSMDRDNRIYCLYKNLVKEFGGGNVYWPQWCATEKSKFEREKIIIGMILVQRTSWHNANMALKNLKKEDLLSISGIVNLKNMKLLTKLVRPAGFWQTKPQRLVDVCRFINKRKISNLLKTKTNKLRQELLTIKGVGKETADTILLYALDKPVFIVDEYTRRWVEKNMICSRNLKYEELQMLFESNLPKNVSTYQNMHTLIIVELRGKEKAKMEVV